MTIPILNYRRHEWFGASLGFNNNDLVEAATKQMHKLPFYHGFAGKVPEVAANLSGLWE